MFLKKWMNKKPLLICLMLLSAIVVSSQTQVEGKIVDSDGLEIIGATVVIKGKPTSGTVSDLDGKYKVMVNDPIKDILIFSYLGMEEQVVSVNRRTRIDVVMKSNVVMLDEVVAIGYATMKRSDISGSVSSVRGAELAKIPVTNVAQALAGKMAGVKVSLAQGSPDANISIRVRGGMSITQSNEPLYIIDGFASENGMQGLDPSDIASIDVLKDASATAIYGSAGANGVILITTRSGKEGKPVISYDMFMGFKKLTNRLDLLNVRQFVGLEYERAMIGSEDEKKNFLLRYIDKYNAENGTVLESMSAGFLQINDIYANRPGVDWQDEVFGNNTPLIQNHKIGVSGGTKTSSYDISYAYTNDDGIMKRSGLSRNSIRGKFTQQLYSNLRITANLNYVDENTTGMGSLNESGYFSRMQHIIQYRPMYERYKNDRDLLTMLVDPILQDESGNQMQNPLMSIEAEDRDIRNKQVNMNFEANYSILKNLKYRGTIGLRNRQTYNDVFYQTQSRQAINAGAPWGQKIHYEYYTLQYNNTLTWNTKIQKHHKIDAMIGQEYIQLDRRQLTNTYTNFPDENLGLENLGLGTTPGIPSNSRSLYKKVSFFGRVNYNMKDKYLATFTLRTDGSSRFGKNNKWGYFPALSLAWRLSEEELIKNLNAFSDLKLRLSYGLAGNDNIGNHRSLSRMTTALVPFSNNLEPGVSPEHLANTDIKWETNATTNIGLDMGFFDQRMQVNIDLYSNETRDLLLEAKLPLISGYRSVIKNIGKTQNRGVEFALSSVNIENRDFNWTSSVNLAYNKNKVKALAGIDYFTTRSGWATTSEFNENDYIIRVGESMGQMYGYKLKGLYTVDDFNYDEVQKKYILKDGIPYNPASYPKPGSWKYEDIDTSDGQAGVINDNDKTVIGNATPDLIGGVINNFTYKGFDLSVGLSFQIGGDVYNANKMYYTKMNNRGRNSLAVSADRFTYIDENGNNVFHNPDALAAANKGRSMASIDGSSNLFFHSGYIEDASFLRLENITLGYRLPKTLLRKTFINNVRLYASTYNLFTITGYSGFDPEVNVRPNGGLTPGIDWGAYPRSLTFVFGLNLTL